MEYGQFCKGEVFTLWCVEPKTPDRLMQLVETSKYVNPKGNKWQAAKNRFLFDVGHWQKENI